MSVLTTLPRAVKWPSPVDVHRCESIAEAIAYPDEGPYKTYNRDLRAAYEKERGYMGAQYWYGVASLDKVKSIVSQQQWPEGADRLLKSLENLTPTLRPRSIKRQRRWAAQGDSVEMTRVWAGRLDVAWQHTQREQRTGAQRVLIVSDVTINCNISSEISFWRGAAAVKLADLVTEAGYAVQLDVANTAYRYTAGYPERNYVGFVTVKPSTAPLDIVALASTVCLPGFFRYYLFRLETAVPHAVSSSLGQAVPLHQLMEMPAGAFVVTHDVVNAETARAWINRQLVKLQGDELAGEAAAAGAV